MTRLSHHSRQSSGYVLIVTLALLVTSTTLLVAVGRAAVERALRARLEVDRLQREWGVRSCNATLLTRCETILKDRELAALQPTPVCRTTVTLAARSYDIVISDEQAKANVNALIDLAGVATAESRIRNALSGTGIGNAIQLHPMLAAPPTTQGSREPARVITSIGQVYEHAAPEQCLSAKNSPFDGLTCFGDGALNIVRASEPSMRLALSPPMTLTEIGRLITARDAGWKVRKGEVADSKSASLPLVDRLLADARIVSKSRARLAMTDSSRCHSLAITVRDGRRAWFYLYVIDDSNPRVPRLQSFVW